MMKRRGSVIEIIKETEKPIGRRDRAAERKTLATDYYQAARPDPKKSLSDSKP
jgi:hypothetical protein